MATKSTYILVLLLILSVVACSDKTKSKQQPTAQKSQQTPSSSPAVSQKEEIKIEQEVYTYDPKGRRDPFVSLIDLAKERTIRKRTVNPIENFDVEEIKLIAIAWDNKQYFAMITLPDKKSYTIRKGMTLGLYGGRVEEIKADTLHIREQIKDYRGQIKTKDTILKLRKEGEE
jgi:type IV pilus assembly protein PilP